MMDALYIDLLTVEIIVILLIAKDQLIGQKIVVKIVVET
jgi:hypothetical protein